MRLDARIKRIENQVKERGITLAGLLKCFPRGIGDDIRRLLIERLPHTGPVSLTQVLDALPEDYARAVRWELANHLVMKKGLLPARKGALNGY
jgi:hypothetical protein